MKPIVFINLPVKRLEASIEFYTVLGFKKNDKFSDETAACMVYSDEIMVMLLTHQKFQTFAPNPIANANEVVQVINALSMDGREVVDKVTHAALEAGATEARPVMDEEFMYLTAIRDLDGHIWEFFHMNADFASTQDSQEMTL